MFQCQNSFSADQHKVINASLLVQTFFIFHCILIIWSRTKQTNLTHAVSTNRQAPVQFLMIHTTTFNLGLSSLPKKMRTRIYFVPGAIIFFSWNYSIFISLIDVVKFCDTLQMLFWGWLISILCTRISTRTRTTIVRTSIRYRYIAAGSIEESAKLISKLCSTFVSTLPGWKFEKQQP